MNCSDENPIKVGIAYGPAFNSWLELNEPPVDYLAVQIDQFRATSERFLFSLGEQYPLVFCAEQLSLGTPGPLNPSDLDWLSAWATSLKPLWICAPLAFSRSHEVDLRRNLPLCYDEETLGIVAEHAAQIMTACSTRLLVTNIASPIQVASPISEPVFLNRLGAASGCGVRLDPAALAVNGVNHHTDALDWVRDIDIDHIVELRLGGYRQFEGAWEPAYDEPIGDDIWAIAEAVLARSSVEAVTLELAAGISAFSELAVELSRLKSKVTVRSGQADTLADAEA